MWCSLVTSDECDSDMYLLVVFIIRDQLAATLTASAFYSDWSSCRLCRGPCSGLMLYQNCVLGRCTCLCSIIGFGVSLHWLLMVHRIIRVQQHSLSVKWRFQILKTWFPHPQIPSTKICVIFDVCHMIKLMRNLFVTKRCFVIQKMASYIELIGIH